MDENEGVLLDRLHALGVGHEVGREVALVELHPFHHLQGGVDSLGFLHRDGPVLANLVHGIGDDIADGLVPVGRDGRHLGDLLGFGHGRGDVAEFLHDCFGRLHDAPLQRSRIGSGSDVAQALAINGLGQDRRRGGAVTGHVGCLGRDLANELGAHVFKGVLQFDLLGHRHPVLGNGGAPELLVENDVATGRSEGAFHGARQFLHPAEETLTGDFVENEFFSHISIVLFAC